MTPANRYRLSRRALTDLGEIWDHIARRSPEAADRFLDQLHGQFSRIVRTPQVGRVRDELMPGLRGHVFRKYIIFYSQQDDLIEVYRVLHGARDIESIFARDRRIEGS